MKLVVYCYIKHTNDMNIAILIPVYNDWQSLFALIQHIDNVFDNHKALINIYVIDDYSSIKSYEFEEVLFDNKLTNIYQITQISLNRNLGHQGAIAIGICHVVNRTQNDCIVIMDADGEDQPEDIHQLLKMMEKTNSTSAIFAKRRRRSEGLFFKTMYFLFKAFSYFLTGRVMNFGNFSVLPIHMADTITSFPELWKHYSATAVKAKLNITKVACDRGKRIDGKSKMSFVSLILHGLGSISVFAPTVGARMLIVMAFLIFVFALGIVGIVGIRFLTDLAIPGWATYTVLFLGILILQSASMSLLFIFMILNSNNPSHYLLKQKFQHFVESSKPIWKRNEDIQISRPRA
ncbi:MAG: glycosyltransferase [Planctomycetes bacterium]|nr:glycosyltransferase [Planctomycetota bacterium]